MPLLFLYLLTCARRSRFVTVRDGVGEEVFNIALHGVVSFGWMERVTRNDREIVKEIGQNDLKARLLCSKRDRKGGGERRTKWPKTKSISYEKRVKSTECVINGYVVLWRADIVGKEEIKVRIRYDTWEKWNNICGAKSMVSCESRAAAASVKWKSCGI